MASEMIIVFTSTHHLLVADRALTGANIQHDLIPVPAQYGEACASGIRIQQATQQVVEELLKANSLSVVGLFPYVRSAGDALLSRLSEQHSAVMATLKTAAEGVLLSPKRTKQLLTAPDHLKAKIREFASNLIQDVWQDYQIVGNVTLASTRKTMMLLERIDSLQELGINTLLLTIDPGFSGPLSTLTDLLGQIGRKDDLQVIPYVPGDFGAIYADLESSGVRTVFFQTPDTELNEDDVLKELLHLRENPSILLGTGKLLPTWSTPKQLSEDVYYRMAVARIALGRVDIPCFCQEVRLSLQSGANIVIYDPELMSFGQLNEVLTRELGKGIREIAERRSSRRC